MTPLFGLFTLTDTEMLVWLDFEAFGLFLLLGDTGGDMVDEHLVDLVGDADLLEGLRDSDLLDTFLEGLNTSLSASDDL